MTRPAVLPSPHRQRYDADNEAQTRRLIEQWWRDAQAQLEALTDLDAARIYLSLDGGTVGVAYGDYTDGGSLASRPGATYDAGVID